MDINLQGGFKAPPPLPGARRAEAPVAETPAAAPATPSLPAAEAQVDLAAAEQRRYEQVFRAAQSFFEDVFAVSDSTFTIFKDASGQYITRYTSLRDGQVSYFPEPQLLERLEATEQQQPAVLAIRV